MNYEVIIPAKNWNAMNILLGMILLGFLPTIELFLNVQNIVNSGSKIFLEWKRTRKCPKTRVIIYYESSLKLKKYGNISESTTQKALGTTIETIWKEILKASGKGKIAADLNPTFKELMHCDLRDIFSRYKPPAHIGLLEQEKPVVPSRSGSHTQ